MTVRGLQFHAISSEIADAVLRGTAREKVHLILFGGVPFVATIVTMENLSQELESIQNGRIPKSLYITLDIPNLIGESRLHFYTLNPRGVVIDIGRITPDGMKQSAISAISNELPIKNILKNILTELKKISRTGVVAVNIETGEKHIVKGDRYTSGAREMEMNGVPMLQFAGGGKLVFDGA